MAIELKMPALSPTMEKGNLAKWLVGVGDMIKAGDLVAEIETDKATMEFEAQEDGRVAEILVPEGADDVAVGTVIALLAGQGEAAPGPAIRREARDAPVREPEAAPAQIRMEEGVRVSPLARRISAAKGITLAGLAGSGLNGKIVKADLDLPPAVAAPVRTVEAPAAAPPAAPPVIAPPPEGVPVETVKLSGMHRTIARRLSESKRTIPHFYLTVRCNLDALLRLRGDLNAGLAARGIKLSVNDMLIKAMALALVETPDANVQFGGDALYRFGRVDIAMAVAIDGGLVTPVIRGADTLSLSAIASTAFVLAEKARAGKLVPEDHQGGTASISNLGMFGIDEMAPVINPPQALILGIGAGVEQPWKVDGAIALATIMAATASFDHRAINGAVAARFMAAFRNLVETPLRIVG